MEYVKHGERSFKNNTKLKRIKIYKLFGKKDIHLKFENIVKILVSENVEKIKINSGVYTKGYFISKANPKFKNLFNKIKQSNYMSILIEEGNGATDKTVEISNRYSSEVLGELENSLNIF